jgi:feruloyl esterase
MTRVAKAVVHAYYGGDATHSYFAACSDGGREALMEAQRYPEDYEGILAGAPAAPWTNLLTTAVWDSQAQLLDPANYIPGVKAAVIAAAVNAACDAQDGVRDGILNDPRQCKFDPATLLCKEGQSSDQCLTQPQVTALKKLYAGPVDSSGHRVLFGFLPGGMDGQGGWPIWMFGPLPGQSLQFMFGTGYFANMVYEKADWDFKSLNLDRDLKLAKDKTAAALDAVNPDLSQFKARGGKLIVYHGWDDAAIPPESTIEYYQSVVDKMGARAAEEFLRLYMVPGMQHCAGGAGTDSFGQHGNVLPADPAQNVHTALELWVEKGIAPGTIIASKYEEANGERKLLMTRPLCAYPQFSKYKGSGDVNDARNFVCEAGK